MKLALFAALSALLLSSALAEGTTLSKTLKLDPTKSASTSVEDDLEQYPWAAPRNDTKGDISNHKFVRKQFETYMEEIEQARHSGKGIELVWVGDTLMQCMRYPGNQCSGAQDVYNKLFSEKYRSKIFAMGPDTVDTLMYRLIAGQRPKDLGTKVVVMNVGVNDMGTWNDADMEAEADEFSDRYLSVAEYLADSGDDIQVIMLGMLPRGPGREGKYSQPSRFSKSIGSINKALEEGAAMDPQLHFIDCSDSFLDDSGDIDGQLMPDATLPSGQGFEKMMGDCVAPLVDEMMGNSTVEALSPASSKKVKAAAVSNGEGDIVVVAKGGKGDGKNKNKNKDKKDKKNKKEKEGTNDKKEKSKNNNNGGGSKSDSDEFVYENPTPYDQENCVCPSPYDLRAGDSFDSIAERCGVSVGAIAYANDVDFNNPVDLGLQVLIPGCGGLIKQSMKPMNTGNRRLQ